MSASNAAIADFLVKTADYVDALERENRRLAEGQQSIHAERVSTDARKLAAQFSEATGEELDMGLARKIAAHTDDDVRTVLQKLAAPEGADAMGRSRQSRSKEAGTGDDAWDAFGSYIMSDG
jgi:hypothetical protein